MVIGRTNPNEAKRLILYDNIQQANPTRRICKDKSILISQENLSGVHQNKLNRKQTL